MTKVDKLKMLKKGWYSSPEIWSQQPGEKHDWYHAFLHYLRLVPYKRSVEEAWTAHQKTCLGMSDADLRAKGDRGRKISITGWKRWMRAYDWEKRAEAYDLYQRQDQLKRHGVQLYEAYDLQNEIATDLLNTIKDRLKELNPKDITPANLPGLLRVARDLQLEALGHVPRGAKGAGERPVAVQIQFVDAKSQGEGQVIEVTADPDPVDPGGGGRGLDSPPGE